MHLLHLVVDTDCGATNLRDTMAGHSARHRTSWKVGTTSLKVENPVLLSILTDSLARSSIIHLRVNSRCLIGSPRFTADLVSTDHGQPHLILSCL